MDNVDFIVYMDLINVSVYAICRPHLVLLHVMY